MFVVKFSMISCLLVGMSNMWEGVQFMRIILEDVQFLSDMGSDDVCIVRFLSCGKRGSV